MWHALHDAWWRLATQSHPRTFLDALACGVLQTCSLAYRAVVAVRNAAYNLGLVRPVRLPCRVISVGNLTVGGTGKTACVELIARKMSGMGRRVAILSRGYGGRRGDYSLRWQDAQLLVDGQPHTVSNGLADEPQLLARRLEGTPVFVGPKRSRTGRLAVAQWQADTIVLDDGFQHRRVHRDCEIVLVNIRMPFGGWPLLPRGPMREPIQALTRAHVIMLTKADEALERVGAYRERMRSLNPSAIVVTAAHEPDHVLEAATGARHAPSRLSGLRLGLVSSVGDPEGVEATVRRLNVSVAWHRIFPDHYRYQGPEWLAVAQHAQAQRLDGIVTTEKDWVRLEPLLRRLGGEAAQVPVWVLSVRLTLLSGEEDLDARLAGLDIR